jgi:hypothetical protein
VTSVVGTLSCFVDGSKVVADALCEDGGPPGDEPIDSFANDCNGSKGEFELEPFPGTHSGITKDMETGRFAGMCANVAEVGENAAAADRFEPNRSEGDQEASAFAELRMG